MGVGGATRAAATVTMWPHPSGGRDTVDLRGGGLRVAALRSQPGAALLQLLAKALRLQKAEVRCEGEQGLQP